MCVRSRTHIDVKAADGRGGPCREAGERAGVRMEAEENKVVLEMEDGDAVDRVLNGAPSIHSCADRLPAHWIGGGGCSLPVEVRRALGTAIDINRSEIHTVQQLSGLRVGVCVELPC